MKLSKTTSNIASSATLAISAESARMRREGAPVISFSLGEPDFKTPSFVAEAGTTAINEGKTHYTNSSGTPELRQAVCDYYLHRFGVAYEPSETLVSAGAKPLIYEALLALTDPGDEVLLFTPTWVSYSEQIRIAGCLPVLVETSGPGFLPDEAAIRAAVTARTAAMIVNTPSNPTGAVYTRETIEMLARVAEEFDIAIIFDEIYERLVYDGAEHVNLVAAAPNARSRCVLINGVSKAFAMTGWRIGYALGSADVIAAMGKLQSHLLSNPCSISQEAALAALEHCEADAEKMLNAFTERRDFVLKRFSEIEGIMVNEPKGAFYVFADIRGTALPDDFEFCRRLLAEKYIAAVPGSAFFAKGFVRFSYASSMAELDAGLRRIKDFVYSIASN